MEELREMQEIQEVVRIEDKKWTKEEIKELLMTKDNAVFRGLVVIYSLQTADEKLVADAIEDNGVGFNGFDAEFLTSLAKQALDKGWLSDKQMVYARKRMLKYAGQLAKVANGQIIAQV